EGIGMKALQAPRLNPLQKAWLQEIGLDRRLLVHYACEPHEAPVGKPRARMPGAPERSVDQGHAMRHGSGHMAGTPAQDPLQRVSWVWTRIKSPSPAQAVGPAVVEPAVRVEAPQDWESLRTHI